jgi:prepilin-type N-terminal cleavage/methylation domain-containing protein
MIKNKTKNGFTLVELIVAMGIFLVVITLAVGAFVAVSRLKALTSTMKEVQQKTRIAIEMISRLSRQANKVIVSYDKIDDKKILELYFNLNNENPDYGNRFVIQDEELLMYECATVGTTCSDWGTGNSILGESVALNASDSSFEKTGTIPPILKIRINGVIDFSSPYYSDEMVIDTDVILENIK